MRFLFFFLFIFAAAFAPAQSCYVRLEDASGFNTDAYQADLEAAACALRAAFPDTFQNKFKVYDFGFYLHQETFSGSYPEAFAQKIAQVNANPAVPYYLLFGKQTDASGVYTRFWVEVKLPNKGIFYCIDELSPNLRGDLTAKYGVIANIAYEANQKSLSRYYKAEMVAMDSLLAYVTALKTCCIPPEQGNRNGLSCSACAFTEAEFAARLNSFGMISKAFTKIIDTNPLANQGEDIGYEVEFNGSKIDLDDAITSIKNTIHNKFPEVSIKVYPLNFNDNCSNYQDIREQFLNENVDIGILIGVVGTNNRAGTVHWQIISQDVDLASPPQSGLDTFYYFNRAGFFIKKEPGGGPRGVWIDKCGNRCDYYFTFADPIVTPHTLTIDSIPDGELRFYPNTSEPMINKVMVMNKDMIYSHLAAGTAFEPHAFAPWALYSGSTGFEGPFDFSTKDFFLDRENYLFVTDDGENVVAHNYRNMGNFLWGAATRIMGVPEWLALTGAHLNNLFTDGGWDTNDDQWSIQLGRKYAKKMNWKTINGGRGNIFRN